MDISNKIEFSSSVYQKITLKLSEIDSFKGNWKALTLNDSKHLKELRKIATIESIGSSTRIEGATLTDTEVEKLLKSVKIKTFKTRDEEEVAGYYEVLQIILKHYEEIHLTKNEIHNLHNLLLKHSSKDQRHRGKYKSLSNKVVANYPDGTQRTIFNTTEPHLTEVAMENLLQWVENRERKNDLHPLLIVAVFIYEFLSVHPYQDGNGRLSRLLTTLFLMKKDYLFIQYVSFENIIETRKDDYYRALMDGQKNRNTKKEKIDTWIFFFLDCIQTLIIRLEAKYKQYHKLEVRINERQQKIIDYLKKHKLAQIGEIELSLKEYSRNTLKKDLTYLLREGVLIKTGEARAYTYHLKK
jgi:Fic family protein